MENNRLTQPPPQSNWHFDDVQKIFNILNTKKNGLSKEEAKFRLNIYGNNVLKPPKKRGLIVSLFAQFNHVLIYVLLVSAFATAFLQHWIDTSVILGVVL